MTRQGICTEWTTGTAGTAGETAVWTYNVDERWDGTSRFIIFLHGHGTAGLDVQGALQFGQNTSSGLVAMALARTGRYVCCSIQAAGASSWSKTASLTAISNAWIAGKTRGVKTSKYGEVGYSMGGGEAACQLKNDSANIAAVMTFAAALDMDYNYSTPGHAILANNSTWTSEINAAYGGSTAAQFAGHNPTADHASYVGLRVPWKLYHATDDSVIPVSVSKDFVTAVGDPDITMHTPDITGDHTGLWANVVMNDVVAFFDAAAW